MTKVYGNPWFSVIRSGDFHYVAEHSERPGAAVLIMAQESDFLLVRVNRPAIGRPLLEIPRGYAAPGESGLDCALREGYEETGYRLTKPVRLGSIHPNSGLLRSEVELFLASTESAVPEKDHDKEVLSVVRVPISQAPQLVLSGEITDGFSIAAIAHFHFARRDINR